MMVLHSGILFHEDDSASHSPDEYTTFVIPSGSSVWYHDLDGHYEAAYIRKRYF